MDAEFANAVGRTRTCEGQVSPDAARRMAATLDWPALSDEDAGVLPPLWHWLIGPPDIPSANLGDDGHERLGLFIPEMPPVRRMWASGSVAFHAPLRTGHAVTVRTTLSNAAQKTGRTGDLYFIDLDHDYAQDGRIAVSERQTLVYRAEAGSTARGAPPPAPEGQVLARYCLDDLQLFRYSALTFNSHRIHLDRSYCAETEGDSRLVVHGPLLATLLARAAAQTGPLAQFRFRAHYPVRESEVFLVCSGKGRSDAGNFWIAGEDGSLRISAEVQRA
jgi:3-methylfumaryl-CoA hydratase